MKRLFTILAVVAVMSIAVAPANATLGLIYQDASEPGNGYTAVPAAKVGCTECTSWFGLVGLGDCSVATAMKKGGIHSLSFYDVYKKNILGYQQIKIKAYGQ